MKAIRVQVPPGRDPERAYSIRVVLESFLGLEPMLEVKSGLSVVLTVPGDDSGRQLIVRDEFFRSADSAWLEPSTVPRGPLPRWDPGCELPGRYAQGSIPVVWGSEVSGGGYLRENSGALELGVDVFGIAFFLLSRYEEIAAPAHDSHGRFPGVASLAHRDGWLERPVVDEWVEVLWAAMHQLWPRLQRKSAATPVAITHDVDRPFCIIGRGATAIGLSALADLVDRHDAALAWRRIRSWRLTRRRGATKDLCNTFGWLMDESERAGLRSAFYFFGGKSDSRFDASYNVGDPEILELLREIGVRGHEVGLHPSYLTYRDPARLTDEFRALRDACATVGIQQDVWGGRQHYLRWEAPTTWQVWEDAGLSYDASVGYADQCGFRAGTCKKYPVFNVSTRRQLRLCERPLAFMDVSAMSSTYMNQSPHAAVETARRLAMACRGVGGTFEVLWHNNNVAAERDRALYRRLLSEVLP